jgi:hypothetical protein
MKLQFKKICKEVAGIDHIWVCTNLCISNVNYFSRDDGSLNGLISYDIIFNQLRTNFPNITMGIHRNNEILGYSRIFPISPSIPDKLVVWFYDADYENEFILKISLLDF